MSEELRSAAERVRDRMSGRLECSTPKQAKQRAIDHAMLAKAYVAAWPAEAAMPVNDQAAGRLLAILLDTVGKGGQLTLDRGECATLAREIIRLREIERVAMELAKSIKSGGVT